MKMPDIGDPGFTARLDQEMAGIRTGAQAMATMFHALVEKNVPEEAATSMTNNWVTTLLIAQQNEDKD